ncbi:MAG TPA: Crp/Fnr family transcriptional regulator [Gemmatimonadaceae bacterium]|jgi:CRP-like cAMP-binding protein
MPTKIVEPGLQDLGQSSERNRLLRLLHPATYARLLNELELLDLPSKHVLWSAGAPVRSVYFPRSCVVSLVVPTGDDRPVEAATIGSEGFVGVPVALGVDATTITALVQVKGQALRMPAPAFRALMNEDSGLRVAVLAFAHTLMEQTAQTVACNRRHELSERCARWLLMTHDRVGEGEFGLTQDFLAIMLGVRRASVTVAAGMLQSAGLIRYSRGHVQVLDREALEAASCECYRIVRDSYAHALRTATG